MPKRFGNFFKNAAKKAIATSVSAAKGTAKSAVSKINPFDKPINKNDVTDSGTESAKLAYTSVKKGKNAIKTVSRSVKTSVRTIKTVGDVAKTSGRVVYKTTQFAVKTAATTAKVTISATTHITAFLINPIVLVILVFLTICTTMIGGILTIIAGDSATKEATTSAAGLVEVDEQYNNGVNYFNTAYNNSKSSFNSLIDSLYFSYDDLTNSDLVNMKRLKSDSLQSSYGKGFALDSYKGTLKAAWNLSLDASEVLAITYVYLEKEQNTAHETSLEIYKVSYTQEVLHRIISEYVSVSDTVSSGQKCPNGSCTQHVNPEYQTALDNLNLSASAYNDWGDIIQYIAECYSIPDGNAQAQYWELNVTWRIDNWNLVYSDFIPVTPYYTNDGYDFLSYLGTVYESYAAIEQSTPKTLDECEFKHDLHSIELRFYSSEDVMNSLGFTDAEKQWVELTKQGFAANPNI